MHSPLRHLLSGAALGATLALSSYLAIAGALYVAGDDWQSFVLSPSTSQAAALAGLLGALVGAWSVSVQKQRRRRILVACLVLTGGFGPLSGALFGPSVLGSVLGTIVLAPLHVPGAVGAALLLEWMARPPAFDAGDGSGGRWRLIALWVLSTSIAVLCVSLLPSPAPPHTLVERLVLQAQGTRCDEPRYGSDASSIEWIRFSDDCQLEAARRLGKLGPAGAAALPTLRQLVTERRDVDTGDGVVPLQGTIALALAQIGDRSAISSLEVAARMHDKPGRPVARQAIAEALSSLQNGEPSRRAACLAPAQGLSA